MKIIDILSTRPTLSFEFFPPKTPAGVTSLFRTIKNLKRFSPDFVSMTYGAGGSTKAMTEELALRIKEEERLLVMAHVTCSAQTRVEVHEVLARYEAGGIDNVIALRGDPPRGQDAFTPVRTGFHTRPTCSGTYAATSTLVSLRRATRRVIRRPRTFALT